jgi:hypothetical protein
MSNGEAYIELRDRELCTLSRQKSSTENARQIDTSCKVQVTGIIRIAVHTSEMNLTDQFIQLLTI